MTNPTWEKQLADYLKKQGLRLTEQRRVIADVFFSSQGHLDMDTLYQTVRDRDASIGQATVYRTLKVLVDSGLARTSRFGGASTRYEVADEDHHDHLVCVGCGKIVEFMNATIETLQDEVAEEHGFELLDHKMELYGKCPDCRS